MGDPSDFQLSCGGITKQQVVDDQDEFQVYGTIRNTSNQGDSVSIRVEAVGPPYPPDSPFAGQENSQRIDSVYVLVGAGRSETWQTDPETISLGYGPAGEYEIRAELRAV